MEKTEINRNYVKSRHIPAAIEISGFETADDNVHMLEWLKKGKDFR